MEKELIECPVCGMSYSKDQLIQKDGYGLCPNPECGWTLEGPIILATDPDVMGRYKRELEEARQRYRMRTDLETITGE